MIFSGSRPFWVTPLNARGRIDPQKTRMDRRKPQETRDPRLLAHAALVVDSCAATAVRSVASESCRLRSRFPTTRYIVCGVPSIDLISGSDGQCGASYASIQLGQCACIGLDTHVFADENEVDVYPSLSILIVDS